MGANTQLVSALHIDASLCSIASSLRHTKTPGGQSNDVHLVILCVKFVVTRGERCKKLIKLSLLFCKSTGELQNFSNAKHHAVTGENGICCYDPERQLIIQGADSKKFIILHRQDGSGRDFKELNANPSCNLQIALRAYRDLIMQEAYNKTNVHLQSSHYFSTSLKCGVLRNQMTNSDTRQLSYFQILSKSLSILWTLSENLKARCV